MLFSFHVFNKHIQNGCKLKVDMPILTCIFFTFNWLTLTSETHFVKFHPEVASCLLCRGKRKYAPLGMRLIWKYIRNYFLVYQLLSHFLSYLQNYKEFKAKILHLQSEKYGLPLDIKKCTASGWALGDENVIGIRAFNIGFPSQFNINSIQIDFQIIQFRTNLNAHLKAYFNLQIKRFNFNYCSSDLVHQSFNLIKQAFNRPKESINFIKSARN